MHIQLLRKSSSTPEHRGRERKKQNKHHLPLFALSFISVYVPFIENSVSFFFIAISIFSVYPKTSYFNFFSEILQAKSQERPGHVLQGDYCVKYCFKLFFRMEGHVLEFWNNIQTLRKSKNVCICLLTDQVITFDLMKVSAIEYI